MSVEPSRNQAGTKKIGKLMVSNISIWFVQTRMNRQPQDIILNFQLEFPKSDLTIYRPFGISGFFCQMVSTPGLPPDQVYKS